MQDKLKMLPSVGQPGYIQDPKAPPHEWTDTGARATEFPGRLDRCGRCGCHLFVNMVEPPGPKPVPLSSCQPDLEYCRCGHPRHVGRCFMARFCRCEDFVPRST